MVIMRRSEARAKKPEELKSKIVELRKTLLSENAKKRSGGLPTNPGKLKEIRRTIARIYTIAREKGYKINE